MLFEAYSQLINKEAIEPWGNGDTSASYKVSRTVGLRYYELSDHLGNVLATVLDRKTGVKANSGDTVYSYWKADIATATDYYPFGMEMPGRTYVASIGLTSKFGFNGQQKVDEIAGKGNWNTALFWEYDTRRAVRVNPDPIRKPWESPYSVLSLNPILNIDPLGDSDYKVGKDGKISLLKKTDSKDNTIYNQDNKKNIHVSKEFIDKATTEKDETGTNTYYFFRGKQSDASKVFKFLADNTEVEWSQVSFKDIKSGVEGSYITTSYNDHEVRGSEKPIALIFSVFRTSVLTQHMHSHPGKYDPSTGWPAYPSGFNADLSMGINAGDRAFYRAVKNRFGENRIPAMFQVYVPDRPKLQVLYNSVNTTRK